MGGIEGDSIGFDDSPKNKFQPLSPRSHKTPMETSTSFRKMTILGGIPVKTKSKVTGHHLDLASEDSSLESPPSLDYRSTSPV